MVSYTVHEHKIHKCQTQSVSFLYPFLLPSQWQACHPTDSIWWKLAPFEAMTSHTVPLEFRLSAEVFLSRKGRYQKMCARPSALSLITLLIRQFSNDWHIILNKTIIIKIKSSAYSSQVNSVKQTSTTICRWQPDEICH